MSGSYDRDVVAEHSPAESLDVGADRVKQLVTGPGHASAQDDHLGVEHPGDIDAEHRQVPRRLARGIDDREVLYLQQEARTSLTSVTACWSPSAAKVKTCFASVTEASPEASRNLRTTLLAET